MNGVIARSRIELERTTLLLTIADMQEDDADQKRFDDEQVDVTDRTDPLIHEAEADAVLVSLKARLESLDRALARLDAGTYGRSLRSGLAISDDRLEADPAAEFNIDDEELAMTDETNDERDTL
jgi:RNA polymerase-binding transcription factor DksA